MNQTDASRLHGNLMGRRNLLQLLAQVCPCICHAGQQILVFHDVQKLKAEPTCQRSSPQRAAMLAQAHGVEEFRRDQKRAEWQPATERLSDNEHVRAHTRVVFKGKPLPCPPQTTLDLVQDAQCAMPVGQAAGFAQVLC